MPNMNRVGILGKGEVKTEKNANRLRQIPAREFNPAAIRMPAGSFSSSRKFHLN